MQNVQLGDNVIEDFIVTDNFYIGITGLNIGNFSLVIYDTNGVEKTIEANPSLSELGNGNYRLIYTPTTVGTWSIVLKHTLYFPYGKGNSVQIVNQDITSIADMIKRVLGLVQENFYIYNTVYDGNGNITNSKIRLYTDSISVGTGNNILAEYDMISTYVNGNLESYQMVKI